MGCRVFCLLVRLEGCDEKHNPPSAKWLVDGLGPSSLDFKDPQQ